MHWRTPRLHLNEGDGYLSSDASQPLRTWSWWPLAALLLSLMLWGALLLFATFS